MSPLDELANKLAKMELEYVKVSRELLAYFQVDLGGLTFFFDFRELNYKVTDTRLTFFKDGREMVFKHAPEDLSVDGCVLADATGIGHDGDNARLYICDVKGFYAGILVSPDREEKKKRKGKL